MKVVLDTNVVVSGIFFGGAPRALLDAWADGLFEAVLSPSIFDEYSRTCDRLGTSRPDLNYRPVLATIVGHGTLMPDGTRSQPITADPDDDKFMDCAARAEAKVVSGDAHLLQVSGWNGVEVLTPRAFLNLLSTESP